MEKDMCQWWGSHYCNSLPFNGLEVYVDGVCHLLALRSIHDQDTLTLVSFDLSDEVFHITPIGEEPCSPYAPHRRLTLLNGSIALISNYHDDIVSHIYSG
jgi:hypothetical protein